MDGADLKFAAFTRSFSNFSGSIGASFEPTDVITLKVNLARGFRAPSLAELASNGAHEGTNRYEYGEQSLRSETSLQLDGGIEFNFEHFNFSIAGFYNRMNDFIFYRKLGSVFGGDSLVTVDGEQLMAFRFNQQDAALSGLEVSFDLHPHPLDWLHFENNISLVHGSFDNSIDGSSNLPLIPAGRWVSEIRADLKEKGKHFRNFYLKLEADKTFAQNKPFTGFATETRTAGYTLLNAGLGTYIINDKKKTLFSVHLALNNIGDVAWQSHLSRLKYTDVNNMTGRAGVFNTGRNFSVKLNVPLSFSMK
jgi:iron complex outermembrane receptor protein